MKDFVKTLLPVLNKAQEDTINEQFEELYIPIDYPMLEINTLLDMHQREIIPVDKVLEYAGFQGAELSVLNSYGKRVAEVNMEVALKQYQAVNTIGESLDQNTINQEKQATLGLDRYA
jgi:hypothetical protein